MVKSLRQTVSLGLTSISLVGCLQTENSSSQEGLTQTASGLSVLSQSCTGCHSYHTLSAEQLIQQGLIVRGDPERSLLYFRMVGSDGIYGPKNMPPTGNISPDDVEVFAQWIERL
jgi:hypothetical protein